MQVNGPLYVPENLQPDKVARPVAQAQQNPSTAVSPGQDQAQLSVDNGTIQQLKANLSQVPEVRQERVSALRQAISSGSYQVSDQQLSNAISSDLLGQVT